MLKFSKLNLEDIEKIRPYFNTCSCRICDRTPGAAIMWRDYFNTHYAIENGALYFKVTHYGGETAFTAPIGSNSKAAYDEILSYCNENGDKPVLCMVPEGMIESIIQMYPNAQMETNEVWSDYLYKAEPMTTFAGRKMSGQRNHCNKFQKLYENWSFAELGCDNISEAHDYIEKFIAENKKDSLTLQEGDRKILEILENYELYGMCGGLLLVDGKIVGLSIAEKLSDTLFIHIEKCLRSYEGSYPMMVRTFAQRYATGDIRYINREEDDGDPGLRTSKLSYHPIELLKKYTVRL